MTENKEPYYITTPIYYVNDSPHIGHAYTTIACDVMARFMRLAGREVMFLTGTDEHGQKVAKAAEKAGVTPQELCDDVSQRFRQLVASGDNLLQATNDDFIRTTEARHKKAAQDLWRRIEANGYIYKDNYGGWYAVRDEAYYAESELIEKDGQKLAPTGAEVEWVEEESYFFKLSAFEEKLLELYDAQSDFVMPQSRLNEVRSFVAGGLKDLSISRTTFDWGVPVPANAHSPLEGESQKTSEAQTDAVGGKSTPHTAHSTSSPPTKSAGTDLTPPQGGSVQKHVMYVWIDALTNYLTATGFPDEQAEGYQKFWASGQATHVVGKDILRFHAVYWPAFLMAADLPLPKQIVAHGWWTIEGEKMSKSLGNVLSPQDMVKAAGGIGQLRYFMLKAMPFGNDGDFSKERMVEVVNADLANNIGNLAQRSLSMIQKNCEGKVPQYSVVQEELMSGLYGERRRKFQQAMEGFQFHEALFELAGGASDMNNYFAESEPWALKKTDPEKMEEVLYFTIEGIRCIAILLQPFCPIAAKSLLDQLAIPEDERGFENLSDKFALKPGMPLPKPEGVFPRLQLEEKAA